MLTEHCKQTVRPFLFVSEPRMAYSSHSKAKSAELHASETYRSRIIMLNAMSVTVFNVSVATLTSLPGMACYMPNPDKSPIFPEMSNGQFVALRRGFLSRTLKMIQPALLGDVEPSLDDGFTSYFLTSIGPSEDETETNMAQWLAFMKLNAKKLDLNVDVVDANEEEKEERRR